MRKAKQTSVCLNKQTKLLAELYGKDALFRMLSEVGLGGGQDGSHHGISDEDPATMPRFLA